MPTVIAVEVDSDWAPEPGRRPVGGGFPFTGSHLLDGWSGQQGNRALSTAEAEFTRIVNGSARGVWLRNVRLEMGPEMTVQVRHLKTKYLWAQEKVRDKTISMAKVHTDKNRADMQTKPLEGPRFLKQLEMLPLRAPPSGRTQVFGAMLAATILGGVQGTEMVPTSQAAMEMSSPTAMEQVWATAITVIFGSTLAVALLSAWIGYRVCKAPMRLLKGPWKLVRDDDDQIAQVEAPPREEHLAIVESGISRHTQTTPIKHYWTWSAAGLRAECLRSGTYRGQLKAQMIE
ncbi:unnamed protein product, partial [Prorocentrum cordatum]